MPFHGDMYNTVQACIGMFNRYKFSIKSKSASFIVYLLFLVFQIVFYTILYKQIKKLFRSKKIMFFVQFIFYLWYSQTILILSGDIETNPGPTIENNQYLTFVTGI